MLPFTNGLVAGFQIDDGKARMDHADRPGDMSPTTIWPTMRQRLRHGIEHGYIRRAVGGVYAPDATHQATRSRNSR